MFSRHGIVLLIAGCAWLAAAPLVAGVALTQNSFKPPFEAFSSSGKRVIEDWKFGGDASVKENFVRLTPDKQSKRGWLMNTQYIKEKDFTIYLRFRVSGQAKSLFGDGLALWVTEKGKPRFEPGFIMGSTSDFTGFGIIFDTFRNVESNHVHKDISLVFSEGNTVTLDTERPGCDSRYRYHEGREDFHPGESESRVRITLERNKIKVEIDPAGDDKWTTCFRSDLQTEFSASSNWQKNLRLSLSASTGALSDNHDVLEVTVTKPEDHATYVESSEQAKEEPSVVVDVRPNIRAQEVGEHVNDLSYELKDVQEKMNKLHHSLEHSLETHKHSIDAMIKTLQEQEEAAEARITDLEARQKANMEKHLDERITSLEKKLTGNIETRLNKLEMKVYRGINKMEVNADAWKMPLFIFAFVIVLAVLFSQRSIRKLQNRDKMF